MKSDATHALPRRPSPGAAGARLAQLYEEHARMVYGVCRLVLRDADEAEDATQQVFLSAYRSLLSGTEPRNAGAWLGTIARNEARRRAVTRAHRPVHLADTASTVSLEDQADARADAAQLRLQIAALPEKQREAVILRDLYGLRYDEVARALNTSRPAVEALLFRGRRRLQRHLRPEVAASAIVVPLALRESLAYAVPGFAAAAAPVGVLAKLAAVPVAAKLAAAGLTVGAAGTGVVAEERLRQSGARPAAPALTAVDEPVLGPATRLLSTSATPQASTRAVDDEDEREEPRAHGEREREEDDTLEERDHEPEEREEDDDEPDERGQEPEEPDHEPAVAAASPPAREPEAEHENESEHEDPADARMADGEDQEDGPGDAADHADADEADSLADDDH